MRIKIYIPTIILFLLFNISFISWPYWDGYYLFKYIAILLIAVYILPKIRGLFKGRFAKINFVLVSYLCVVILSGYINRGNIESRDVFLASVVYCAVIFEIFMVFESFALNNKLDILAKNMYYFILFSVIITDTLMLFNPTLHIQNGNYYLTGNKFSVSFLHLQLIVFYFQNNQNLKIINMKKNIILIGYIFISMFICINVDCATGLIAIVLVIIMHIFFKKNDRLLRHQKILILVLILSSSFLFLFSTILENEYITYFIENILEKDITLTGRMTIYSNIENVFNGHLLLGYGYGSSYEVMTKLMGAPNIQNGLLECILQQGLIAVILLVSIVCIAFRRIKFNVNVYPFTYMIYVLIALSSVEITLGTTFMAYIALMAAYGKSRNDENIH